MARHTNTKDWKAQQRGEPHKIQESEIKIQRLEIQIQKVERRSRGGSHIPILASVSIRPTAHTPNYFPHSIPVNTNTRKKKTSKYKIQKSGWGCACGLECFCHLGESHKSGWELWRRTDRDAYCLIILFNLSLRALLAPPLSSTRPSRRGWVMFLNNFSPWILKSDPFLPIAWPEQHDQAHDVQLVLFTGDHLLVLVLVSLSRFTSTHVITVSLPAKTAHPLTHRQDQQMGSWPQTKGTSPHPVIRSPSTNWLDASVSTSFKKLFSRL